MNAIPSADSIREAELNALSPIAPPQMVDEVYEDHYRSCDLDRGMKVNCELEVSRLLCELSRRR